MILSRSQKRKSSESVHHIRGQNKNKWAKVSSTRILGVAFIPAVSYPGDSRHTAIQFVLKCRQKKRRKTLVEKNSDEDWSTNNLEQREECIKRDSKSILLGSTTTTFCRRMKPVTRRAAVFRTNRQTGNFRFQEAEKTGFHFNFLQVLLNH